MALEAGRLDALLLYDAAVRLRTGESDSSLPPRGASTFSRVGQIYCRANVPVPTLIPDGMEIVPLEIIRIDQSYPFSPSPSLLVSILQHQARAAQRRRGRADDRCWPYSVIQHARTLPANELRPRSVRTGAVGCVAGQAAHGRAPHVSQRRRHASMPAMWYSSSLPPSLRTALFDGAWGCVAARWRRTHFFVRY